MSGPTNIYAVAMRHRKELLRMERASASEMVRAYGLIWQKLQDELEHLFARMNEAREAGEEITAGWLFEQRRLEILQEQAEAEMRRFVSYAEAQIINNERLAVRLAQEHMGEYVALAPHQASVVASFAHLPTGAVTDLVGFLRNGSPLRTLLDQLGPAASLAVREGLIQGVGAGMGMRQIAQRIRADLGGDLTRALTISRTETLRAYRESTRRGYAENRDIIRGWIWVAAKDGRTCASCWAMDGTRHRLEEHMSEHPNGRCTMIPDLSDMDMLAGRKWGAEAFEELGADQKRNVLGQAGFEAYKAGAVKLDDFVGVTRSRLWGTTRSAKSLSDILGAKAAGSFHSLGAAANRTMMWQSQRMAELQAAKSEVVKMLEVDVKSGVLPKLDEHFLKHGADFEAVGIHTKEQYAALFQQHISRDNLQVFTYIRRHKEERMWLFVGLDNGAVAEYNETRKRFWSFYHHEAIDKFLRSGRGWWIEASRVGGELEFRLCE